MAPISSVITAADFVDALQASGRYTFTSTELAAEIGGSDLAHQAALRRLKQRRRLASPRRGFYVVVPLEYRTAGAPPASWFIDDLLRFLGHPYYVAVLSAAALHGATHQAPQQFQVCTDTALRPIANGRTEIRFLKNGRLAEMAVIDVKTETGSMRVSSPETTALDLVRYPDASGQLSNVATVLAELGERLRRRELAAVARVAKVPELQRLGYLLDCVDLSGPSAIIESELERRPRVRPVALAIGQSTDGFEPVDRWQVIPNAEVEADL